MMAVLAGLAPRMPGQAPTVRDPHIGYVFPAGAQCGTTVEVVVGGQILNRAAQVVVSGPGVTARVLKVYKPVRRFDPEQRDEIRRRIAARRAVLDGKPETVVRKPAAPATPATPASNTPATPATNTPATPPLVMPEHILLDRLAHADLAELDHLVQIYLKNNRMQVNPQLGEMVTLEVTVAPTAEPGTRELRLLTPAGLTNPLRFEVSTSPELCEREPNDPQPNAAKSPTVAGLPVVFNGQVFPGDVDRLYFHAHRAQNLVIEVQARSLIPYLADAVPGWFQPVIAVMDGRGKELAYADDFRFRPDPVLLFRVPDDGDYSLQIRDSLFRGREDFVYRIKLGEQPFVTACFPLGAAADSTTPCRLVGWNLPRTEVLLDTRPDGAKLRTFTVAGHGMVSNPVAYAVDPVPDAPECEPNDTRDNARSVPWPCVVNGRINKPGDVDVFLLTAPADTPLVIAVSARRLGSPLDSVLRVTDADGKVLAWNDDTMVKDGQLQLGDGLLTHHADSQVSLSLPSTGGPFCVQLSDAQRQGGDAYGYRLRIAPAQPDFALRVTPSAINLVPGQPLPVTLHVERRDGFTGAVAVSLTAMPAGWSLSGNVIPPSCERLRMTLQAPPNASPGVMPLHLTGTADVDGVALTRTAEGCDDTMQAFLWRHLVPARECLAAVASGRPRGQSVSMIGAGIVEVPAGGETLLRYRVPPWLARQGVEVVAIEVPDGVTLRSEVKLPDEIAVHLTIDPAKLKPGFADNLILGTLLKAPTPTADAKKQARGRPGVVAVAALPAVALQVQQPLPKP